MGVSLTSNRALPANAEVEAIKDAASVRAMVFIVLFLRFNSFSVCPRHQLFGFGIVSVEAFGTVIWLLGFAPFPMHQRWINALTLANHVNRRIYVI